MSLISDPYQKYLPRGITCCGWGICQACKAGCVTYLRRGGVTCPEKSRCHTGCTGKATIYRARRSKYKWTVCEYCSKRGLYALPEQMSDDLDRHFYIETNEPVN